MGQGEGTDARTGQGVGTGVGHRGFTWVLQTQFSSPYQEIVTSVIVLAFLLFQDMAVFVTSIEKERCDTDHQSKH